MITLALTIWRFIQAGLMVVCVVSLSNTASAQSEWQKEWEKNSCRGPKRGAGQRLYLPLRRPDSGVQARLSRH
jgi:hypothetical protein